MPIDVQKTKKMERVFVGIVVSTSMQKTLVVNVATMKQHPKYRKRYLHSKRYKVHDEKGQYQKGEKVRFVECRPLSREKRWRVLYA